MNTRRALFLGILAVALAHGTLYLLIVPPWDHYDEPTHLEYGWLIANRLRLPKDGEVDLALRRELSASMLEQGFQYEHTLQPALLPGDGELWIGVSELSHPPLYYALIAVPLRLVRHADILTQLYIARSVSLLLYLVTVACAWGVGKELTQRPTVDLCVPASLALVVALLPGLADMMTAVNSDAGAAALFSVFLWSAARAIRRRETVKSARWALAWATLAALLCPFVKNTAAVALVLLPLVWVLALSPPLRLGQGSGRKTRRWLVTAIALGALLATGLMFRWGNAALWLRTGTPQHTPTRQKVPQAPVGDSAMVLEQTDGQLRQILPVHDTQALRGQTVTLGAWIWSTEPVEVIAPRLWSSGTPPERRWVQIDDEPIFYALTSTISSEAPYLYVDLYAAPDSAGPRPPVYYDGVVLAQGERVAAAGPTRESVPRFDDPNGEAGVWAGQPFENWVRNGSGQAGAPYIWPQLDQVMVQYTRRSPSQLLGSLWDWERSAAFYPNIAQRMLETFWARFGWNQIPLPKPWYWVLGAVSLACMAGSLLGVARMAGDKQEAATTEKRILLVMGLAGAMIWIIAVLRLHPLGIRASLPVARYAYPAIVPTALVLVGGAVALTQGRLRWLRVSLLCGEGVLAGVSLATLIAFHRYRPQTAVGTAAGLVLLGLCLPAGLIAPTIRTWWQRLRASRRWAYAAGLLIALGVAVGALWMGQELTGWTSRQQPVTPHIQAIREVNALAQTLKLSEATVGIATELQISAQDLRQIDGELLYRLRPLAELVCQPGAHDLVVLPGSDGTALASQAHQILSQDDVPHITVDAPPAGILVAVLTPETRRPESCPPLQEGEALEKLPPQIQFLDGEAPIPAWHRPDETWTHAWQATTACTKDLRLLIAESRTATYSRLQESGQKMQLALRGRILTKACKLGPGTYRFEWWAFEQLGDGASREPQLQVSVLEHPVDLPPRAVRTRVLRGEQAWGKHTESFTLIRGIPVSLDIQWLDGPGYPVVEDGQPQVTLALSPTVKLLSETSHQPEENESPDQRLSSR